MLNPELGSPLPHHSQILLSHHGLTTTLGSRQVGQGQAPNMTDGETKD